MAACETGGQRDIIHEMLKIILLILQKNKHHCSIMLLANDYQISEKMLAIARLTQAPCYINP